MALCCFNQRRSIMMFNKKKGQAAMEFLMTYGWAILVVLIVIGALAYFGVLNPQNMLPEKCVLGVGLSCSEYQVVTNGAKLKVLNGLGETVTVTSLKITDPNSPTSTPCSAWTTTNQEVKMKNGEYKEFFFNPCIHNKQSGEKAKFSVELQYYKGTSSTFSHTVNGELLANVESNSFTATELTATTAKSGTPGFTCALK